MSSNERLPRSILPKADAPNAPQSDSVSDESSILPDEQAIKVIRTSAQVRSNIRSACLACRQRRSKCTGGTSCSRCQTLGTECVYEEGQDRRTRAIREKGKEELELHKKVLDGLFRAIRNGGDRTLLNLVREHASLQEMAAAIDSNLPDGDTHKHYSDEVFDSDNRESLKMHDMSTPATLLPDDYLSHTSSHVSETTGDKEMVDGRHAILDPAQALESRSSWMFSAPQPVEMIEEPPDFSYGHIYEPLHDTNSAFDYIDRFYVQFRESSRHMIQQGIPRETVLGGSEIRCDLVFRARQQTDPLNVYTWASTVVNIFPDVDIYFRLAWLVMLVRFMQWSVDMSKDNFQNVPDIMKPTNMQVTIQHMPSIDLAPLYDTTFPLEARQLTEDRPQLRDALIEKSRDYCAALQLSGVSVSWTQRLQEAVLHDATSGSMTISRAFEDHVSQPHHFFFGRAIFSLFPDLKGKIQVVEDDFIPATTLMNSPGTLMSIATSIA